MLTYSISGGADLALFTINSSSGVLSFVSAPDYELPADAGGNNVYDVTVQVSDGSLTDTQAIAVTITDVDEFDVGAVTDTNAAANAVNENAANGTAVGITASATDPDGSNNTITYSLDDNAGGRFAVLIATGQILGEGVDISGLDTLFLAFPVSFRGKLAQYIGRISREGGRKTVYDYRDIQVPLLEKMWKNRAAHYRKEKFVFREE